MNGSAPERFGDERSQPPEQMFEAAWQEINERMARLRLDLDLADRVGLGDETKKAIAKKLLDIQKMVDVFAERWMDFEKRRKALEDKVKRQP
ncbi:hypothetical protein GX411_05585 [Candidatus Fermentibacteria bacterium]|nr:hypothetical protein [Candidatus Fermentibacteria bacterium]